MANYLVVVSLNLVGRRLKAPGYTPTRPKQLDAQRLHDEPNYGALEVLGVV